MADGAKSKRYSDREVSDILRRAADIQSRDTAGQLDEKLTLERLTQAAAEIGIDPGAIQQAARELRERETHTRKRRPGFVVSWDIDETILVKGEITPQNWPMILEEIRDCTGRVGYPAANGTGFEWISRQPDPIHVSFTPAGASVKVRVKANLAGIAPAYYVAPTALSALLVVAATGLFGGITHIFAPDAFIAAIVGIPTVAGLLGRRAFRGFSARRSTAVQSLLNRIEASITGAQGAEAEQNASAEGNISIASTGSYVSGAAYSALSETPEEQVLRQRM